MNENSVRLCRCLKQLLSAAGYPELPAALADPAGSSRFPRGWTSRAPGSLNDLVAVFGLADKEVAIEVVEAWGDTWALSLPEPRAILGALPRKRRALVRVHWKRSELLQHARALLAWCDAVARAWLPLEWDEFQLWHAWQGALAVDAQEADLPIPCAELAAPARFRRAQAPALAVLSVRGAPRLHEAGSLAVANPALGEFLTNAEPFIPAWKPARGQTTWTALRDVAHVDVLIGRDVPVAWSVNGRPQRGERIHRVVERLMLDKVVKTGESIQIVCQDIREGYAVPIFPNPVVFQTSRYLTEETRSGPFGWYRAGACKRTLEAHTFETLLAGCAGIEGVKQPHPVVPTLEDGFVAIHRARDIERLARRTLLGVERVCVEPAVEWNRDAAGGIRRVIRIRLERGPDAGLTDSALKAALRRQFSERLADCVSASALPIEIVEKPHERESSQSDSPRRQVSRRVRPARAPGAARRAGTGAGGRPRARAR